MLLAATAGYLRWRNEDLRWLAEPECGNKVYNLFARIFYKPLHRSFFVIVIKANVVQSMSRSSVGLIIQYCKKRKKTIQVSKGYFYVK